MFYVSAMLLVDALKPATNDVISDIQWHLVTVLLQIFSWFRSWNNFENRLILQCEPGLCYSVDLRIQTYTEPVPLKHGKLATKYSYFVCNVCLFVLFLFISVWWIKLFNIRRYADIFTVYLTLDNNRSMKRVEKILGRRSCCVMNPRQLHGLLSIYSDCCRSPLMWVRYVYLMEGNK